MGGPLEATTGPKSARIGVFVCHCGHNIAGRVRVPEVVDRVAGWPGVCLAADHHYMCSDPGQGMVKEAITGHGLDAVVVACCSHRLHERTFRLASAAAGLNPHRVEIANIREQCAWIHEDMDQATAKAIRIVDATVEKARRNQPLEDLVFPVTPRALVIGGGIAGMQAALDIADAGGEVVLVDREASLGGNMARLSETYPTLDCAQCTLTPRMSEVGQHPKIELLMAAEVEAVEGYVGNFRVRVRQRPRYVDWEDCTGCGACWEKCPVKTIPSDFDRGLGTRPAIFTPFPQAVPNRPVIDAPRCLWFGPLTKGGKRRCGACATICPTDAIRFDDPGEMREIEVGTVVVATGYDTYDVTRLPEYGGGALPDVIDSLQFERLLSASGPTAGQVLRPSDGAPVRSVAFVHCAGSRDENHRPWCSKLCCTVATKHALLFLDRVPDGQAVSFYIDLRHAGRDQEEFLVRAQRAGLRLVRGKATLVEPGGEDPEEEGQLVVHAEDTLAGRRVRVPVDLVVLATATEPAAGTAELARTLRIPVTPDGFLAESHIKLRPVESVTAGYYLAGAAQGPKDIPDSVAQGSAAASKVIALLHRGEVRADPAVAVVHEDLCIGCRLCLDVCPVAARTRDDARAVVVVNPALCTCCGACAPACPTGAAEMVNASDDQLMAMVESALGVGS